MQAGFPRRTLLGISADRGDPLPRVGASLRIHPYEIVHLHHASSLIGSNTYLGAMYRGPDEVRPRRKEVIRCKMSQNTDMQ